MNENNLTELVSIPTLSRMLDVPEKTIRGWVWKRQIPYHKLGKLVRFHVGEVRTWYGGRRVTVAEPNILAERII